MKYKPEVVSWNITNMCNLRCSHCYLDASYLTTGGNELGTEECLEIVDGLADAGTGILILTGGEPLMRQDIKKVIEKASEDMMVVIGTNGLLLNKKRVKQLVEMGVGGIGVSIDSLEPEVHDSFRGQKGAWDRSVKCLEICRDVGLEFTIQTTVNENNYDQIEEIARFANEKGARSFNLYFLVCTGRGESLADITPEMYEEAIERLVALQEQYDDMLVRAKCAPHVKRVAHSQESSLLYSAGCMAATSYCRITPEGKVTPCPYMEVEAGNLLKQSFKDIWKNSLLFRKMREDPLGGRCGECEYAELCFGCRARAYAFNGDYMDEDPWCDYTPKGKRLVDPQWSDEALDVLDKMPFFIRGTIKRGVEGYAKKHGIEEISRDFFFKMARKAKKKRNI